MIISVKVQLKLKYIYAPISVSEIEWSESQLMQAIEKRVP